MEAWKVNGPKTFNGSPMAASCGTDSFSFRMPPYIGSPVGVEVGDWDEDVVVV
jgi:hypothetical protein